MNFGRFLVLLFIFPLSVCGQTDYKPTNAELTRAYTHAISDFIKTANQKNKTGFDTLYFGKRANGQPDDFPNITLPQTIAKTQIRLITPAAGEKSQKENKKRIYINLMGWVDKEKAQFIFVVFSNGFQHQYDYTIDYKYNPARKEFELEKVEFKGPPFDK